MAINIPPLPTNTYLKQLDTSKLIALLTSTPQYLSSKFKYFSRNLIGIACIIPIGYILLSWILDFVSQSLWLTTFNLRHCLCLFAIINSLSAVDKSKLKSHILQLSKTLPKPIANIHNVYTIFTQLNLLQILLHIIILLTHFNPLIIIIKSIDVICQSLYLFLGAYATHIFIHDNQNNHNSYNETICLAYLCSYLAINFIYCLTNLLLPMHLITITHKLNFLLKPPFYLSLLAISHQCYKHWHACYQNIIDNLTLDKISTSMRQTIHYIIKLIKQTNNIIQLNIFPQTDANKTSSNDLLNIPAKTNENNNIQSNKLNTSYNVDVFNKPRKI